jgi:hypothetical protein
MAPSASHRIGPKIPTDLQRDILFNNKNLKNIVFGINYNWNIDSLFKKKCTVKFLLIKIKKKEKNVLV